jgi:hypothetical protein
MTSRPKSKKGASSEAKSSSAKQPLPFGEDLLDRIEVRTVRREVEKNRTARPAH